MGLDFQHGHRHRGDALFAAEQPGDPDAHHEDPGGGDGAGRLFGIDLRERNFARIRVA